MALAGSVDTFCVTRLVETLQRIGIPPPGGLAVLDATDLEFIDFRALIELDRCASRHDATLVLRSPPAVVPQLMELVDLYAVRVE